MTRGLPMTIHTAHARRRYGRRRGVARRLLQEALEVATAAGARALEAFPRRAEGVSDAEHWMGPPALY